MLYVPYQIVLLIHEERVNESLGKNHVKSHDGVPSEIKVDEIR